MVSFLSCRYERQRDLPTGCGYTYPLARQALISTYFCFHATDYDTFRTSCLILSIITFMHFNVYNFQSACELCISRSPGMLVTYVKVPRDGSHLRPFVRWQIYLWYFLIVCSTPRLCLYFNFWTSFMSHLGIQGVSNDISIFGKFEYPSVIVHM